MAQLTIEHEQSRQFEVTQHGSLIHPSEPKHDDARAVENGLIDEDTALIARFSDVAGIRFRIRDERTEEKYNA